MIAMSNGIWLSRCRFTLLYIHTLTAEATGRLCQGDGHEIVFYLYGMSGPSEHPILSLPQFWPTRPVPSFW